MAGSADFPCGLRGRTMRPTAACLVLACAAVYAGACGAQQSGHSGDALGEVDFPVSCAAAAQPSFNQAMALLHHMTYPQARQAFDEVAQLDPACAMAYWGMAMTLFQPLWPTRPSPQALQQGWQLVEAAQSRRPPTEREALLVASAEAFFLEPAGRDYWARIRRWEAAMQRAYAAYPQDHEVAALYALAHLAAAPVSASARQNSDRAADILLGIYRCNPDHPGAMHYLVHANDTPGRERESLEITRRYERLAPRNPHALHMPTHIYTRLGDWEGVIRGNLNAAEAALEHPAGEHGEWVWDEFPHAIEYLVYAYLQTGADDASAAQIRRLLATPQLEPSFKTAFHLASTRARHALERHDWQEASQLVARDAPALDWDRFAWPEAISHFARGLGAAHLGRPAEAAAAIARLDELERVARQAGEELFARNIRVLRLELEAWLAHAQGQAATSLALMQQAAELETATPKHAVTPAPTLPAHELLGDLLMEQQRPADALDAYRRALEHYPRRLNALLGAARAAGALGDTDQARGLYRKLLALTERGTRQAVIEEARRHAAGEP